MWSPLEKALQGIIEGSTRASFTTMSFLQFSMLNLGSNHGCDLKARAIHYDLYEQEPLACCSEIGRLDQHFGSSWGNEDHRKRAVISLSS
jgi:hypothetical protein